MARYFQPWKRVAAVAAVALLLAMGVRITDTIRLQAMAEAQKAELSPVAASVDEMRRAAAGSSSLPDPPEREHQHGHGGHRNGSTSKSRSLLGAARSSSLRYRGKPGNSSSAAVDDDRKPSARNLC